MNPHRPQRGVSVAEVCCTLAIVAILAAVGMPAARSLLDARRLEGMAGQLAADLRLARGAALARRETVRLSLHASPTGSCYVIHTGPADACRCPTEGPAWCDRGAEALRTVELPHGGPVALEANVGSMLFDPQRGTASPAGTWRLTGRQGRTIHAVVNLLGRVRLCAPDGRVAGYHAC